MDIQTSKEQTCKMTFYQYFLAIFAIILSYPFNCFSPHTIEKVFNKMSHRNLKTDAKLGLKARTMICTVSQKARNYDGCIKRSLGVYMLLWIQGYHCTWCTGYSMDPFRSHAWIEIDKKPIGEPNDIYTYSKVIETT